MSAQSAGVVITDEAVTQLRMLLSTLQAVCYFEPMSMVSLSGNQNQQQQQRSLASSSSTSAAPQSSPFKNRHESITSIVDTKTAFATDEDHQNAKREKSIVDFDNEVKRIMAFGGGSSGSGGNIHNNNVNNENIDNNNSENYLSSSTSANSNIRYELMSGLIIFPHSDDAKLKRSQVVSEVSEKLAKLM